MARVPKRPPRAKTRVRARPAPKGRKAARPRTSPARDSDFKPPAGLAVKILDILETVHPEARCALDYRTPFELSIATILSAQCTDERVNMVTPALFDRYPTPQVLAEANPAEVESMIRSTGFFRAKTKSIIGFAQSLVRDHGGELPRGIEAMRKLPGVGRKTANVVLGHAYGINEGIAVDTHVLRVSNRLGIAKGDDPLKVEAQLMAQIPRERWTRTTDLLIFHGRKICDARKPRCGDCPVFHLCRWEGKQSWAMVTKAPAPPPRRRSS
jgi:endonuclease-3